MESTSQEFGELDTHPLFAQLGIGLTIFHPTVATLPTIVHLFVLSSFVVLHYLAWGGMRTSLISLSRQLSTTVQIR